MAPFAGAAVSPDLARIRQINDTNAWGELLKSDVKSVSLTEPILVTLLGLSLPRATMLIGELAQVGVDTIGTLLLAAEDANSDGSLKPNALLPRSIEKIVIKAIAALRDKVNHVQGEMPLPPSTLRATALTFSFFKVGAPAWAKLGDPVVPAPQGVGIDYVRPALFDKVTTALYETRRHSLDAHFGRVPVVW